MSVVGNGRYHQKWSAPASASGLRSYLQSDRGALAIAVTLVAAFLMILAFADWIAPYDPAAIRIREKFSPPTLEHPFGTNSLGQDIFSRVLIGTRISMGVTLAIIALGGLMGTALGLVSGFYGGWIDFIVMRITDVFFAFPVFILAMAISAVLGPSLRNLVISVSIVWWPAYCRLVRSEALRLRVQPFIEAVEAVGASPFHIMLRHLLPNCMKTIVVKVTTDVAYTLLIVSGLNFVGLGAQPPTPELGSMVAIARPYIMQFPWLATFPGLAIFLTAGLFAFLGDTLEDRI